MKRLGKKLGKPNLLTSRKVSRGVLGRKLDLLGEFACNISFVGKKEKSSGACVKKHDEFIRNGWYCLIRSLGPTYYFVL